MWSSNGYGIKPVSYSPSGKGTRGIADVVIDVNGTLTAEGAVYTTSQVPILLPVGALVYMYSTEHLARQL